MTRRRWWLRYLVCCAVLTGYVMKQLATAGVSVWSYLERRDILMSSPTDKFLMSAMSFAAEVEREKARERSRDAARQRAARGAVTGGTCYGYRNTRDATGFVVREIVPRKRPSCERFSGCARRAGARDVSAGWVTCGRFVPPCARRKPMVPSWAAPPARWS